MQMTMYRRDTRFSSDASLKRYTLDLERTVLDMLHCPMRMHEKVLNLLYQEILIGKTKNEVNSLRPPNVRKRQLTKELLVKRLQNYLRMRRDYLNYIEALSLTSLKMKEQRFIQCHSIRAQFNI